MNKKLDKESIERSFNVTMDELVEKIKEMPSFHVYRSAVASGKIQGTDKLLGVFAISHGFQDEEFGLAVTNVSHSILFHLIDQRLRYEILKGDVNG